MKKYQIWNKQDTLVTPSGKAYTAEEIKAKWAWVNLPGVKAVVAMPPIALSMIAEFSQFKEQYRQQIAAGVKAGAKGLVEITDDLTDDEVLRAIETYEETEIPEPPSAEERIAAALEYQNLLTL